MAKPHLFYWTVICILVLLGIATGCNPNPVPTLDNQSEVIGLPTAANFIKVTIGPTAALNLPAVVKNLSDDDPRVRIASMEALSKYGDDAVIAIPKLIENLHYKQVNRHWPQVRLSAVKALSRLGPKAKEAVTDLGIILQDADSGYHVWESAAFALGEIGDPKAIPALANGLYQENAEAYRIAINCANAIAKITHEPFRDANPKNSSYSSDIGGAPFLVLDARKWWEEEGKFQDWNNQ